MNKKEEAAEAERLKGLLDELIAAKDRVIIEAAANLYDNRLGWSKGRNPYAPPELWDALGRALGRPEDGMCNPQKQEEQAETDYAKRARYDVGDES